MQRAFLPQAPLCAQGLTHFSLTQALSVGQLEDDRQPSKSMIKWVVKFVRKKMVRRRQLTDTSLMLTHVFLWALVISGTLGWWEDTLAGNSSIASVIGNTRANTIVIEWLAEGILSAGAKQSAWILTLIVYT